MTREQFAFGPFVLDPSAGTLVREGVPVPLGYRGLRLLAELVRRAGDIVPKADLMEAAWPGTVVEEGNLSVQVAALRKLLGDSPDGADWIATVPRVGYRFVGDVERSVRGSPAVEPTVSATDDRPGASIAVLPFENLGGDPEQEYFADGLADDLITRLLRLRSLFVCARSSSFAYKGRAVDVKQVGRELGVRYVLQGSVQRSGDRLRISAQLADAASGLQVWAERYDVKLADFFALQDQIAESVVAAMEPRLYAAEHRRIETRPPDSLDAWGFVMKAMPYAWTWGSEKDIDTAQELLRRAIAIDPDYARANSLLAWAQAARVQLGWGDPVTEMAAALASAHRALASDAEDPWSHLAAGYAHMVGRRPEPAIAALNEALALNPGFGLAHVILGSTYGYSGRPDDGLHHLALATRLSPRDFSQAGNLATMGLCHFMAGRFAEAVHCEQQAVRIRPHFGTAWRTLAASAGQAGDRETGARALAEAKRLHPGLSVEWVERYHAIVRQEDRTMYIEGLRASGLR